MARMSIYVADELKSRMDGVDSNWSAIAQAAFEQELRFHPKLTESDMQTTIERLKASKAAQTVDMIAEGAEAGKRWAMEDAEYLDLKEVGGDLKRLFAIKSVQRDALTGEEIDSLRKFPALRNGGCPPGAKSAGEHFEHGFCLGVFEVWKQVEDKI
jgi:hypothetical protein